MGRRRKRRRISKPSDDIFADPPLATETESDTSDEDYDEKMTSQPSSDAVAHPDSDSDDDDEVMTPVPGNVPLSSLTSSDPLSDRFRLQFAAFLLLVPPRKPPESRSYYRMNRPRIHKHRARLPATELTPVNHSLPNKPHVKKNVRKCLNEDLETVQEFAQMLFSGLSEGETYSKKGTMAGGPGVAPHHGFFIPLRDRKPQSGRSLAKEFLKTYHVVALKQFYRTFCDESVVRSVSKYGRGTLEHGLIERFFAGTWAVERREEEAQFHREMGGQDLQLFFEICGVNIARDVVELILAYVGYDYDLICSVGLVGFNWFALVLATWKAPIRIHKGNMMTVPTEVLKRARIVEVTTGNVASAEMPLWSRFEEGSLKKKKAAAGGRFTVVEMKSVFSNVVQKCDSLRELRIGCWDEADLVRRLSCLKVLLATTGKRSVRTDTTFQRLRRVVFFDYASTNPKGGKKPRYWQQPKSGPLPAFLPKKWPELPLSTLSPDLQEVLFPRDIATCADLQNLQSLSFNVTSNMPLPDDDCLESIFAHVTSLTIRILDKIPNLLLEAVVDALPRLRSFSFRGPGSVWKKIVSSIGENVAELPLLESLSISETGEYSTAGGWNQQKASPFSLPAMPLPPPCLNLVSLLLDCSFKYQLRVLDTLGLGRLKFLRCMAHFGRNWGWNQDDTLETTRNEWVHEVVQKLATVSRISFGICDQNLYYRRSGFGHVQAHVSCTNGQIRLVFDGVPVMPSGGSRGFTTAELRDASPSQASRTLFQGLLLELSEFVVKQKETAATFSLGSIHLGVGWRYLSYYQMRVLHFARTVLGKSVEASKTEWIDFAEIPHCFRRVRAVYHFS